MFEKILVPLDGSPLAERALPYAEALAAASGGTLLLVRVALAREMLGRDLARQQMDAIDEATGYLDELALSLEAHGVPVETAVPLGEAASSILTEIRLRHADLVVMATHGRSGLGRWLYGSVAEAVLAGSSAPVLLVRTWQGDCEWHFDRATIVVPLDGSALAQSALPLASRLVRACGGRLVLTHAVPLANPVLVAKPMAMAMLAQEAPGANGGDEIEERLAAARAWLQEEASRLDVPADRVGIDVRVSEAADAIAAAAMEYGATLVVMATHGRTGLGRLLLGSTAADVLRRGQTPVLMVRPDELGPARAALLPQAEAATAGQPLTLNLHPDEVVLLRAALHTFGQAAPQPGHLGNRIGNLLARLDAGHQNGANRDVARAS